MREVVILSAARTPIGKFGAAFKDITAVELGGIALKAALQRAMISPALVEQVIIGQVLQAGNGQNPARQVALKSGIPQTAPAMTINEVCGSGLKAVILGKQAIQVGAADTIVVGGMENMSQTPLFYPRTKLGGPFTEVDLVDSMVHDGLRDAFSHKHMGLTAETVADCYGISRKEQDNFAACSQAKAAQAQSENQFNAEIVPVTLTTGEVIAHDQAIRPTSTLEKLGQLPPIFKADGSVTAGNASPINDGAAMLVLMAKETAEKNGLSYLATLGEYTEVGNAPEEMGYAPYYAIKQLLHKLDKTAAEIDCFELNEAFASQSVAVARDLMIPLEKINPKGGAIALGHPLGASGARILTTLLYTLAEKKQATGIASLCVGGGIGIALAVSRA